MVAGCDLSECDQDIPLCYQKMQNILGICIIFFLVVETAVAVLVVVAAVFVAAVFVVAVFVVVVEVAVNIQTKLKEP